MKPIKQEIYFDAAGFNVPTSNRDRDLNIIWRPVYFDAAGFNVPTSNRHRYFNIIWRSPDFEIWYLFNIQIDRNFCETILRPTFDKINPVIHTQVKNPIQMQVNRIIKENETLKDKFRDIAQKFWKWTLGNPKG